MGTIRSKSKVEVKSVFTIYLPEGKSAIVSALGLDIRDGALLLLDGNKNVTHAVGPGHWLSVNINPH